VACKSPTPRRSATFAQAGATTRSQASPSCAAAATPDPADLERSDLLRAFLTSRCRSPALGHGQGAACRQVQRRRLRDATDLGAQAIGSRPSLPPDRARAAREEELAKLNLRVARAERRASTRATANLWRRRAIA
jgi:hypothetical protein